MLERLKPWSPATSVMNHSNSIKIDDLRIAFKRTIRVPDNYASNELPPELGNFPIFKVDEYADKLPISMAQKGGVFLPIHQGSLVVDFMSINRYAIKISVGGINVISGEPAVPNAASTLRRRNLIEQGKSVQDYVVVGNNGQYWLDGLVVEPGKVRQFVAMPIGTGHSVKAQMTGQEATAGIHFEVTRLDLKPRVIELPEINHDNKINFTMKLLTGKHIPLVASHDTSVEGLKYLIELREGIPIDQQRLVCEGRELEDGKTLQSYNIADRSVVHVALRLRGGWLPPKVEMSIAAGGLINQGIVKLPRGDYQKTFPVTFNVQILNSTSFQHVTGKTPPQSPISAETYADAGYPFFSMYEEPITTISGDFEGLKSVAQVDEVNEESMPADMPVVKIGAVGLLNPRGSKQELELEWEVKERLGEMRTLF
ncbi:uncharacterized protein B0J16DRAFT_372763 [Fusarium flagelliforme]|uniref:uncharacterized protein n=1 Tax=Fusarium flagelliforme TaxID=2675880 RepID=UPI001E8EDE0A|nr:uncharacterized protein B0J16DRAFT_372763 [Fusarium flagelliforme]KAH7186038.1 hypothetical protein B0J16DRAFT_372763 [Fusarium flagelliforme]